MSSTRHAILAHQLFDGETEHHEAAVVIEDELIAAVIPRFDLSSSIPIHKLPEGVLLAPGFIDIQVNGGGDALFNDQPTPETILTIAAAHRKFGTTALLPTLISDSASKMTAAIAATEALVGTASSVLGIHLEGPFLSPLKAGVHDVAAIREPTEADFNLIAAPRRGVTLVTLAPEQISSDYLTKLVAARVRVSLGHSMATYQQACDAMAKGASGFTHLFNAMRPLESREPGPIAAALENPSAYYSLIVDNIHVALPMLRLALRGLGRPILVTDAMPPVGGKSSNFKIGSETVTVHNGRCEAHDGKLAGAFLDMASAVRNCVRWLEVPLADALRFASVHPAQFLGLGNRLGRLARGFRADMVALDTARIEVLETWVAGRSRASLV
jgi:N-acetylglucosamine-6-phosphate deacetylase